MRAEPALPPHAGEGAEVEAAWDQEVERRLATYDRGEMQAIDREEVLAKARRLAEQRPSASCRPLKPNCSKEFPTTRQSALGWEVGSSKP